MINFSSKIVEFCQKVQQEANDTMTFLKIFEGVVVLFVRLEKQRATTQKALTELLRDTHQFDAQDSYRLMLERENYEKERLTIPVSEVKQKIIEIVQLILDANSGKPDYVYRKIQKVIREFGRKEVSINK